MEKKVLIAVCPLAKPAEVKILNLPDITINCMEIEDILSPEAFVKLSQPSSQLNWNFLVVIAKLDVKINGLLMQQLLKYMVFDHQAGIIDFGWALPISTDIPEEIQDVGAQMIDCAVGAIINAPSPKPYQLPPSSQILKEIVTRIASSIAYDSNSRL